LSKKRIIATVSAASAIALFVRSRAIWAGDAEPLLTGAKAFGDWHDDAPGVRRKITVADLRLPLRPNLLATILLSG
jgi:hypothetical protein